MVELKFHAREEPLVCTQCGKDDRSLIELIIPSGRGDPKDKKDDTAKEHLYYCVICWEMAGHTLAERFTRWPTK